MNEDHAEDTKAIVQHWTSVPVCHLLNSMVLACNTGDKDGFVVPQIM